MSQSMRLRKGKSPKSPFGAQLFEAPPASKISIHRFSLFEGCRAPIFAKNWAMGWWNKYTGLALQEGNTNVRNVVLPCLQGFHFFFSWSSMFHQVWWICLLSLHCMVHIICNDSKHGNQKKNGVWTNIDLVGLPVSMACFHCGNLVDEGWYQLTAVLNFCVFNKSKKNSNYTQFIQRFLSR